MSCCIACRRPLTNPVSIKHGYGPDCLKRAAALGNAPLIALDELKAQERSKRKAGKRPAPLRQPSQDGTPDLFSGLQALARKQLEEALAACLAAGLQIEIVEKTT